MNKNNTKDNSYLDYVINDLMANIDGITHRAMFGGYGIYKDGYIFGLIADDQLYFKVDDSNKADYESLGSKPFVYEKGNHPKTTMSYWLVPQEVLEDKKKLTSWINRSVNVKKSSNGKKS